MDKISQAEKRSENAPSFLITWRDAFVEAKLGSSAAKSVGMILSTHMLPDGGSCFPGIPRIARECEMNQQTVRKAILLLEATGWIHVDRSLGGRGADGRGRTHHYFARIPEPLSDSQGIPLSDSQGSQNTATPPDLDENPSRFGQEPLSKPQGSTPIEDAHSEDAQKGKGPFATEGPLSNGRSETTEEDLEGKSNHEALSELRALRHRLQVVQEQGVEERVFDDNEETIREKLEELGVRHRLIRPNDGTLNRVVYLRDRRKAAA